MAFTWGEILEDIRDSINETSAGFFKDSYILRQFNWVQLDFCRRIKCLKKENKVNIQSDGLTIALPSDVLGIIDIGVEKSDGSIAFLSPTTMEGRANKRFQGDSFYITEKNQVKLISNMKNQKAIISYYAKPTPLADEENLDQEVEIQDEYVDTIITGVVARALSKHKEFNYWQIMDRRYQEGVKQAIIFETKKHGQIRKTYTQ